MEYKKIEDIIEFNPTETIKKGTVSKKISMDKLGVFSKYINSYDIEKYSGGMKFRNGDTLLARITPCLENGKTSKVTILDENEVGFGSTEFIVMRSKKNISDEDFIFYLSISPRFREIAIKSMTGTSGRQRVQLDVIKNTEMLLPSYKEQVKIGKILTGLDEKITLNNHIDENISKLCKYYYNSLINDNCNETSLSDLMDYQGGSQPPSSEFKYEQDINNIRFIQIRDFESNSHICYIPISKKNKLCEKDDILIARYGASLGRICYGLKGAYNVALAKVLPKKEEYKEMLRIILEDKKFYEYINSVGQRSAQSGFNVGDIQAFKVKVPKEEDIKKFHAFASVCLKKRLAIIEENNKLINLRDLLLPKLINGEINLDKIEV